MNAARSGAAGLRVLTCVYVCGVRSVDDGWLVVLVVMVVVAPTVGLVGWLCVCEWPQNYRRFVGGLDRYDALLLLHIGMRSSGPRHFLLSL